MMVSNMQFNAPALTANHPLRPQRINYAAVFFSVRFLRLWTLRFLGMRVFVGINYLLAYSMGMFTSA